MAVCADGNPYRAIGGEAGLRQCMQELVERLAADEELACFYDSVNADTLAERLTTMFAPMLGSATAGTIADLDTAHGRPFALTNAQWLRWSGHLMTLLYLRQLDDTALQQFASLLSTLAPPAAPRASPPDSGPAASSSGACR